MAKRISKALIEQMRDEYVTTDCTYDDLATKYNVGRRTVDNYAGQEGWTELRKDARHYATLKAKDELNQKMSKMIVRWDSDVLDTVEYALSKIKHKMERENDPSDLQLSRWADAIDKLNNIQRKTTERDITKIQAVDVEKQEEIRDLLLGKLPEQRETAKEGKA